jgi:hypothetical protein
MRKEFFIPVMLGMLTLSAQAFAQSGTVVMRNGDRVQAEVRDMGQNFSLRVNGQPRQVPIGDIVLIDFTGNGRDISNDELSRANAANGYIVMKNGETFNASLKDLTGEPLIAIFTNGRRANLGEVSRIYLGSVNNVPGFPAQAVAQPAPIPDRPGGRGRGWGRGGGGGPAAPANARSVVVPANVQWTNAGFNVSRGQYLQFQTTGELRLSTNGDDVARAAGAVSGRRADNATIPSIPVGALIGRVGNGQPFAIGDTINAVDMPANGRLYLGINDDHVDDNSGNFVVKIWEP